MATVRVAVPAFKFRLKLHLNKGRPWSVIEHVILQALVRHGWTIGELETAGALPRRVVIEALVRLMRAGWVELTHGEKAITFSATSVGLTVAPLADLPNAPKRIVRPVGFVVDGVSGAVFGNRDLFLHEDYVLSELEQSESIIRLKPDAERFRYDLEEVQKVLLDHDELFVAFTGTGERAAQRYALVTVRDGEIVDGLPARDLKRLRQVVLNAAGVSPATGSSISAPSTAADGLITDVGAPQERSIRFAKSDVILDSEKHLQLLKETLDNAATRVFIHSTFIKADYVSRIIPEIRAAAQRGVRIDILWGQNEDLAEIVSSRKAIDALRNDDAVKAIGDLLTIHAFSTKSHAKIIVADSRKGQPYLAVVGSCNWLSSGFVSYEASVVVRDPPIVADIVRVLANISHAHNGIWSDLTNELTRLAELISEQPSLKSPNATACVVIGAHHNRFVLRARDEAHERIFLTSHRLGPSSENAVVAPLIKAAKDGKVSSSIYFCRSTGAVKHTAKRRIIEQAAASNVRVEPIESPRLHAKILAWDSDCILITSLNWLSADPASRNEPKEVGLWIRGAGLADLVIDNFVTACETVSVR